MYVLILECRDCFWSPCSGIGAEFEWMLTAIPLKHGIVAACKVLRESGKLLQLGGGGPGQYTDASWCERRRREGGAEWRGDAGLIGFCQGLLEKQGVRRCGQADQGATHRNFAENEIWEELCSDGEAPRRCSGERWSGRELRSGTQGAEWSATGQWRYPSQRHRKKECSQSSHNQATKEGFVRRPFCISSGWGACAAAVPFCQTWARIGRLVSEVVGEACYVEGGNSNQCG